MSGEEGLERGNSGWALAVAVVLLGTGIAGGSPFLVALAVLPLAFVAADAFDTAPDPTLEARRELVFSGDGAEPPTGEAPALSGDPGERVTVRVTVHNTGPNPIVDLRLVDGVPDDLPVVAGSPRACLAVGTDETASFEYEVELRRGVHTFDDVTARGRGPGATVTRTWSRTAAGDDTLRCLPAVEDAPVEDGTNDYAGEIPTDEGGSGVEFYSVREYEPGDPVRSIDWRRYASSRDLATVEFRAERATRVVCLVDRRTSQKRAASPKHLHGVDLSVAAAERTFEAIFDAGHPTGVVGFKDRLHLRVQPGTDAETRLKGTKMLEAFRDWADRPEQYGHSEWGSPAALVPSLLPGEAQVVLFSTFVDDTPLDVVEQLRVHGYPVTVVSPDVTADRTDVVGRVAALDRRTRLSDARTAGATVADWDTTRPLGVVLEGVVRRVSSR